MRPSVVLSLSAFLLAVLVIGCGGSGGGSGGPGGGSGGGVTKPKDGQYLEFVSNTRGMVDPLNLVVGDDLQVVVANYDPAGNRTILPATGWTSTDTVNAPISSTGRLRIVSRPPGVFLVTGRATVAGQSKVVVQDCAAPLTTTTSISGRVVSDVSGVGVEYVQVTLYDASFTAIGGVRSGDNGVFRVRLPANFDSLSLRGRTIPAPPYFKSFTYNKRLYAADDGQCPVRVPNLVKGQNNPLASNLSLWLQINGPPPPPNGCQ